MDVQINNQPENQINKTEKLKNRLPPVFWDMMILIAGALIAFLDSNSKIVLIVKIIAIILTIGGYILSSLFDIYTTKITVTVNNLTTLSFLKRISFILYNPITYIDSNYYEFDVYIYPNRYIENTFKGEYNKYYDYGIYLIYATGFTRKNLLILKKNTTSIY